MFKCKICQEKDKRIEDLYSQISDLRQLVYPKNSQGHLPIIHLEANKILSNDEEITELTQEQIAELDQIESEATTLLMGTY